MSYGRLIVIAGALAWSACQKTQPVSTDQGGNGATSAVDANRDTSSQEQDAAWSHDPVAPTMDAGRADASPTADAAGTNHDGGSTWVGPAAVDQAFVVYDGGGELAWRKDEYGFFTDGGGAPAGRVDEYGNYYAATGAPAGHFDVDGNYFDGSGASAGRLDAKGFAYDRFGAWAGRLENSWVYDKAGATFGRVDGTCDAACLHDVAKWLIDKQRTS